MGTWGLGPFDNDCAGDWLAALRHGDVDALDRALAAVHDYPDYLEVDEGQAAIAAAEFVASAFGRPIDGLPGEVRDLVAAHEAAISTRPELARQAHAALARVMAENSELLELWDESPEGAAWRRSVETLDDRLRKIGHG